MPRPPAARRHRDHGSYRWLVIKEWIPDDDPDLDWFNRPRNPSNPDPDGFDQSPAWQASEVPLGDGYTLVLKNS